MFLSFYSFFLFLFYLIKARCFQYFSTTSSEDLKFQNCLLRLKSSLIKENLENWLKVVNFINFFVEVGEKKYFHFFLAAELNILTKFWRIFITILDYRVWKMPGAGSSLWDCHVTDQRHGSTFHKHRFAVLEVCIFHFSSSLTDVLLIGALWFAFFYIIEDWFQM